MAEVGEEADIETYKAMKPIVAERVEHALRMAPRRVMLERGYSHSEAEGNDEDVEGPAVQGELLQASRSVYV